jgi:hypothetical protein
MSATTTSFDHARPLLPPDRWRPQSPTTAVPTRPSPPWFPPPPLSRRPTRAPPPLSSAQARREGQHDFHASTVIAPHLYPSSLCSRVAAPLCTAPPSTATDKRLPQAPPGHRRPPRASSSTEQQSTTRNPKNEVGADAFLRCKHLPGDSRVWP